MIGSRPEGAAALMRVGRRLGAVAIAFGLLAAMLARPALGVRELDLSSLRGRPVVCDRDGIQVSYRTSWLTGARGAGYRVTTVIVRGIAQDCRGKVIKAELLRSGRSLAIGRATITGTSMVIGVSPRPLAALVGRVHVRIFTPGLLPLACSTLMDEIRRAFAGTDRNDEFAASDSSDLVVGGGGADRIWGRGGRDCLDGNGGADLVSGGSGADVLLGSDGDDALLGGRQDDLLRGGEGNDRIDGGPGWDVCEGGAGDDVFSNCEEVLP